MRPIYCHAFRSSAANWAAKWGGRPCPRFQRRFLAFAISLIALLAAPATAQPETVRRVALREVDAARGRVVIARPEDTSITPATRLILATDARPVGWLSPLAAEKRPEAFTAGKALPESAERESLAAWIVPGDLAARLLPRWPTYGALLADIESIGPGGRTVWLTAGRDQGVAPGQTWWVRTYGQPVARLDVALTERRVCFCRVVPLVDDPRLSVGQEAELWPSPGERKRGTGRSAVAYAESSDNGQVLWLPIPPGVVCPVEPRVDLFRDAQYVGHAVVERRSDRFWFARTVPSASSESVHVGDTATIRTQAVIDNRSFVARVGQSTSEGHLINVGEAESVQVGDIGTAYRDSRSIGRVEVKRVQATYSVVTPAVGESAFPLIPGDAVRFAAPPVASRPVGKITELGEHCFIAQAEPGGSIPLQRPLAIRMDGRTCAVGVAFTGSGEQAVGLVVEGSRTRPLAAGAQLVVEEGDGP